MKSFFTKLFSPILNLFETEQPAANYKPSHRLILIVVGSLFTLLSSALCVIAINSGILGGLFPALIFFAVGLVALVVGSLGSDNAVAKIWGNKS
ncbi:hypothetical protein [Bacterioplanoides sp.]|uniref:hypothetical protein n=1 Tax=Bacterioplanoides sp. TaxID=2066072 RepID=UPI003B002361